MILNTASQDQLNELKKKIDEYPIQRVGENLTLHGHVIIHKGNNQLVFFFPIELKGKYGVESVSELTIFGVGKWTTGFTWSVYDNAIVLVNSNFSTGALSYSNHFCSATLKLKKK